MRPPALLLEGVRLPQLPDPLEFSLSQGDSHSIVLPDLALEELERLLYGREGVAEGRAMICGCDAADEEAWTGKLRGKVAGTRSAAAGAACWIENLDLVENILLAELMAGCSYPAALQRAEILAQAFGLAKLPESRRSEITPADLQVCQWVRAFMPPRAEVMLMVDPFRGVSDLAMGNLLRYVADHSPPSRSILWLLPPAGRKYRQFLGAGGWTDLAEHFPDG